MIKTLLKKYGILAVGGIALLFLALFAWGFMELCVNRINVPEGHSLMLRYMGPTPWEVWASRKPAKPGHFAEEGEVGILGNLRGPGRHFYNPFWYERTIIPDLVIENGSVGIVTCKVGADLPPGEFLVDGDLGKTSHKGMLRKVLHPGSYRVHRYAYEVKVVKTEIGGTEAQPKHSGWVTIPTGYVGVVTNLADNPITKQSSGIQDKVLPPGIYPINGREQQIDIVNIGIRETTVAVTKQKDKNGNLSLDELGEPLFVKNTGISFPAHDGFPISLDYSAIWGIMPDQAAHNVKTFGNVTQVENKVIIPQINSICRNNGSELPAKDLLVGAKREEFQNETLEEFQTVMESKDLTLLFGLVRHIYIPQEARAPIQKSFIADEMTLTREQEKATAIIEGQLREAEKLVDLATATVDTDTTRQVAKKIAEGEREAKQTQAETDTLVANIERQSAEANAEAARIMGEAENNGKRMVEEAKAERFKLAVEAFGTPEAYNSYTFADKLPENIQFNFMYAGPGTLWTDSKSMSVIVPQSVVEKPKPATKQSDDPFVDPVPVKAPAKK